MIKLTDHLPLPPVDSKSTVKVNVSIAIKDLFYFTFIIIIIYLKKLV